MILSLVPSTDKVFPIFFRILCLSLYILTSADNLSGPSITVSLVNSTTFPGWLLSTTNSLIRVPTGIVIVCFSPLNNLNTIDLDDSNIMDFSFLKYLSNLKCISISGSQFRNNKSLFKELVYNGVKVTNRHSFIYTKEDFDND